jgi:mono/diheme cytochrome c family protein
MKTAALIPLLIVFTSFSLLDALCLAASAPRAGSEKDRGEWKAPARAARKPNPLPADAASLKAGKVVYIAECVDCHGRRGAGDGPGTKDLKSKVPPLTNPDIWRQSDGALFWKISTGRGDMPGFEDMLGDEKRWQVLNYARATFGPRATADEGADVAAQKQRPEAKR